MTVLTWRDVAAPDFRGVQDGLSNASDMLNKALGAARDGITRFDNQRTERADNALLADLAALQDAGASQTFLRNIASRPGLANVSGDTLKFAMGRPDALVSQAGHASDFNFTEHSRGKVYEADAALKAAQPVLNQAALLADSGRRDEALKLLSESPEANALPGDLLYNQLSNVRGAYTGDTSARAGRFNYDTNVRDDTEGRQITTLAGVIRQNGVEPADFDAYVTQNYDTLVKSGISPVVIERARAAVLNDPTAAASFYENGTLGGGGGAAGGGGAGGDFTRVANYQARAAGVESIPENVQTLGQWSNWASGLNQRGIKSSAAGLYQITGETLRDFAPQVLGSGWQSQPLTPENQDKIGRAIFESTKGSPEALRARWTSLSPQTAAAIAGKTWEQARDVIAKGESGATNVQQIIAQHAQNVVAQAGPTYNASQDSGQALARGMIQAMGSDADVRTVAAGLIGGGKAADGSVISGVLAGENIGNVTGVIKQISQQYKISPAAAGLVLAKSVDQNKNWYQRAGDNIAGIFGGGDGLTSHIDWDQVKQLAGLAGNRDALLKQVAANTVNSDSAALAASTKAAADAAAAHAKARESAAARLGRKVTTTNAAAVIANAATAAGTRDQAIANAGAITQAGGNSPPPPPRLNFRGVPKPVAKTSPVDSKKFVEDLKKFRGSRNFVFQR